MSEIPPETFGEFVARMRARAGYRSQTALGRELGRQRGAVAAWEADESTPEPELFPQLARAIGVPPDTLLRLAGLEPGPGMPVDPELSELADQAADLERRLRALAATPSAEGAKGAHGKASRARAEKKGLAE